MKVRCQALDFTMDIESVSTFPCCGANLKKVKILTDAQIQ
jgi:hypothetical protein